MSITTKKEKKQSKGVAGSGLTQKELELIKRLKNIRSAKPASRMPDEFDMDDMAMPPDRRTDEQKMKDAIDSLLAKGGEVKKFKDGGLAEATAKLKAKGMKAGGEVKAEMTKKDKVVSIDTSPNSGLITVKGFGAGRKT